MRSLLLLTMALAVSPAAAEPPWTKASPGGGGAFLSVDVSATGKVLVGSDLSGAYLRSGTGTWTRLGKDDGLLRTSVACVRWSPATGESALAGGRNGLFRSVNAGASWQATGGPPLFQDHYFGAIGWSRGHSATVYAAGAWSTADTTVLLWRSLDGGANWAAVAHDLPTSEALRALKLVVHPSDPNTVYMITGPDGSIAPTVLVPKRALYVSTNGGSTWALKSGADEALDVAVHPTTVGTLLMTVSTGIDNTGLVKRSIDGGDIWSMVLGNTGAVWWDGPNAYLINVGLDACGPIPANAGKFMSSDGGLNWSRIDTGSTWETGWTDCPHARGIPDGGVANALSGKGEYWVTGQFVWRYAGGKFTNAFSTGLGSDRWITTGIDNSVPTCLADAQSARTLYAGYYDLGMWRTEDSGASWRMINPVLPNWDGVGGNAASIVADPARPGMVWAAIGESSKAPYLYRVYRSTNFGDAWSPTTGLPYPAFLYGLSLDRQSPIATRKLWVTANGALYRSTDDGQSWQPASTAGGLPTTGLLVTEIDRRNGNTIFVGGWAGLWRSFDGGVNWLELSAGFDHSSTPGEIGGSNTTLHRVKWHGPHQILSDPTSQYKWWVTSYIEDTTEVAALHRGLYMSINNGNSWVEVKRGPHYRGIAIDSLGKRAMLTSSAATTSGCNSNEINATVGIEHGRSTDGLSWTWTPDSDHPDLRYPFGWTAYAGGAGQRWVGIPGYGFVRKSFPPVAGNDAFVVGKGSAGNLLPVLFNDAGEGIVIASVNVTGTLGTPVISGDSIAYTPPAGYTGVDWFAYTIQDVSGVTASATVAVNVVAVASDTVVIPISAGTDDAEESASGSMNLASSDIDMTFDLSQQKIGLRFNLVAVPQGADITGAYVQFHVDETSSEATSLTVRGQLADSPGTFTSASGNISARPPTLAGVPWSPPPWLAVGAAGTDQRTPDLSPVIQEIVDRPGWVSGNSLVLLVTGTGRRVAQSREFSAAGAATLYVSYGGGGSIPVAVGDPPGAGFAIHRVHPTPSRGAIHVELSLADARPARLELIDVAGRRVASRDLGPVGPGRRRVDLAAGLGSGIYIIRLTQGERSRTAKAVVLE
ncbi:MAG: Ig-like domain-containing protein [Candidatus Eiseniibacteriota bacterium]